MRHLKKYCSVSILVSLFVLCIGLQSASALGPTISVDVKSGRVVAHDQAFQKWYPASLTKLMTAYIVFREIKAGRLGLKTNMVMSANAAGKPASKMYLKPGTQYSVDSALKYLLVKSANDVAVSIGENISGSEQKFVAYMNSEAKRLGMMTTRFANPNGLPGGTQYTTARDMAVLAVAILNEFPKYQSYFSIESFSTGRKTYQNYNLLLGRFKGASGMKTGYICASGFNLVAAAKRGRKLIVSVVLGAKSQEQRAIAAANLLQAGFSGKNSGKKLKTMKPYGANRNQLANIRNQICTQEARAARNDGRDLELKIVEGSKYISYLRRQRSVTSAPFATVLSSNSKFAKLKNVPIPAPSPRR